jgi:hypothetical protein
MIVVAFCAFWGAQKSLPHRKCDRLKSNIYKYLESNNTSPHIYNIGAILESTQAQKSPP